MLDDLPTIAYGLTSCLSYLFELALCAYGRVGAVTWAKLTDSRGGEAALAVVGKRAGTSSKDCRLDLSQVLRRAEEDEFVADGSGCHGS